MKTSRIFRLAVSAIAFGAIASAPLSACSGCTSDRFGSFCAAVVCVGNSCAYAINEGGKTTAVENIDAETAMMLCEAINNY